MSGFERSTRRSGIKQDIHQDKDEIDSITKVLTTCMEIVASMLHSGKTYDMSGVLVVTRYTGPWLPGQDRNQGNDSQSRSMEAVV